MIETETKGLVNSAVKHKTLNLFYWSGFLHNARVGQAAFTARNND